MQELQGRLQHCLVDLLTLQVEADHADGAASVKAAQLLPPTAPQTAAHGHAAKLPSEEPLPPLHGGGLSMAASEEAWVQVSARQRQQQQQAPLPADEVSSPLDGEEDDFEAQLRASEVPPPAGHGVIAMLPEVTPPSEHRLRPMLSGALPLPQRQQTEQEPSQGGELSFGRRHSNHNWMILFL